ncbi:hypothetical protein MBLNU230_g8642t1 [Neophaeotheca triangularis]
MVLDNGALGALANRPLLGCLTAIGGLWAAHQAYTLASFTYHHFLRRSTFDRYKDSSVPSWALVTGASNGIGRGFAEELCSRGFSVILHGRNPSKLESVKADLLSQWPECEIKILVLDAANEDDYTRLEANAEQLKYLNIKVLVNNVAGSPDPLWATLTSRTGLDISTFIDATARFPDITRVLLPQLIERKPSLILTIGSGASEFPGPYISVLSGCKAFNKSWSRCLTTEMKVEGHGEVEVLFLLVGMVATTNTRKASTMVPSPRRFAKSGLEAAGSGRSVAWAYWPHALQFGVIGLLPDWIAERMIASIAVKEKALEEAEAKNR